MSSNEQLEQKIVEKGLIAPRVTLQDLQAAITDIAIVKHITKSGSILRWAVITTPNGFSVTGKPSAAVSAANDNAEIGEEIAVSNAKSELWALLGYELATKLCQQTQ